VVNDSSAAVGRTGVKSAAGVEGESGYEAGFGGGRSGGEGDDGKGTRDGRLIDNQGLGTRQQRRHEISYRRIRHQRPPTLTTHQSRRRDGCRPAGTLSLRVLKGE